MREFFGLDLVRGRCRCVGVCVHRAGRGPRACVGAARRTPLDPDRVAVAARRSPPAARRTLHTADRDGEQVSQHFRTGKWLQL